MLDKTRTPFILELNFLSYWDKGLLSSLLGAKWIMRFSSLVDEKKNYSWSCVNPKNCSHQSFQVVLFRVLCRFLFWVLYSFCTDTCWSVLSWRLKEDCSMSLEFSLWTACSSLIFCFADPSHFGLPFSQLLVLSRGRPPTLSLHAVWKLSRKEAEQDCRTHLVCFLFLKGHCLLLPDSQCFENYCFVYFVWLFSHFRQEGKSDPCYSWSAVEVCNQPDIFYLIH